MFGLSKREAYFFLALLILVICMPTDCFAENFETLRKTGKKIFDGLRSVIYPASAIGIICVCIGGFFGNINWKWLTVVVVGLIVISLCSGFIELFTKVSVEEIEDRSILGGE